MRWWDARHRVEMCSLVAASAGIGYGRRRPRTGFVKTLLHNIFFSHSFAMALLSSAPKVYKPATEVDLATGTNEHYISPNVKAPRVAGFLVKIFTWVLEMSVVGWIMLCFLLNKLVDRTRDFNHHWLSQSMADGIIGMRKALKENLEKLGSPLSWEHITNQEN